jgi:hypothetical protein
MKFPTICIYLKEFPGRQSNPLRSEPFGTSSINPDRNHLSHSLYVDGRPQPPFQKIVLGTCYGANGISHSLTNTHLVIMAIHNAIGKWVESPATPEKILEALGRG